MGAFPTSYSYQRTVFGNSVSTAVLTLAMSATIALTTSFLIHHGVTTALRTKIASHSEMRQTHGRISVWDMFPVRMLMRLMLLRLS